MGRAILHNMTMFFKMFLSDPEQKTQVLEYMKCKAHTGLYNSCLTNQQRAQSFNCGVSEKNSSNTIEYLIGTAADQTNYNQQEIDAPAYHTRSQDTETISAITFENF